MLLQLRSRSRSFSNVLVATEADRANESIASPSHEYIRLPYEEDDDIPYLEDPTLMNRRPPPSNASCIWMMLVFSLGGVMYLWSIAFLLASNSPYLMISHDVTAVHDKATLARSVKTAAVLYGVVVLACMALLWRGFRERKMLEKREKE